MIENLWHAVKYFFCYPLFALFPPPLPYRLARGLSRFELRFDAKRRESVCKGLSHVYGEGHFSPSERDRIVRDYFEMVCCDEIDVYIYLSWFSNRFLGELKVEGLNYLEGITPGPKGIFLTAHFGGGFWILPFLRNRGIPASFLSAEIRRSDQPGRFFLYLYQRFRIWAVRRASGKRVLSKGEGKQGIRKAMEGGEWVIVLLDVPPFRVKDRLEVPFLGKRALFPKGILSIARDTGSSILPFCSFVLPGRTRGIRFEKPIVRVEKEEECARFCAGLIEGWIRERPGHWHFWPIAHEFFQGA